MCVAQVAQGAYVGDDWLRTEIDGSLSLGVGVINLVASLLPEAVLKLVVRTHHAHHRRTRMHV